MAQKVRAGKRFEYDLEAVLKVRAIKEKKEQEKFAEKQRIYYKEKKRQEDLEESKHNRENELRNIMRKGTTDISEVRRRKDHLTVLKEDLDKQIEKVIEANRLLEEQRAKLITAMKDKKIMETDKDNKFDDYKKLMNHLEMKFLDEIATQRFVHIRQFGAKEEAA